MTANLNLRHPRSSATSGYSCAAGLTGTRLLAVLAAVALLGATAWFFLHATTPSSWPNPDLPLLALLPPGANV